MSSASAVLVVVIHEIFRKEVEHILHQKCRGMANAVPQHIGIENSSGSLSDRQGLAVCIVILVPRNGDAIENGFT